MDGLSEPVGRRLARTRPLTSAALGGRQGGSQLARGPLAALRRADGVVALETMISMIVLLMMTLLFGGIAAALHNQAVLNGATQLAAQESVIAYDRIPYRNSDPTTALAQAQQVASDVYTESSHGLVTDVLGTRPKAIPVQVSIQCANGWGGSFSQANCTSPSKPATNASRIEKVTTIGSAPMTMQFLDFLTRVNHTVSKYQTASGNGYSSAPCSRFGGGAGSGC